ncbi:MAG: potassium channel family protein [Planctomycetes bacterium]|nr:potassium channel family protein [Planctomycetota bacterium]
MPLRRRVHELLEADQALAPTARLVRLCLAALIVLNSVAVVLETVPSLRAAWAAWFDGFERVSVAVFTTEYLLRAWAAPETTRYAGRAGRLRWACSPMAVLDLAAILPAFLAGIVPDLRTLRLLRLLRIVRIVRLGRYSLALQTLLQVLRTKAPDLLSLAFLLAVLLVLASTLMFYCEHEAQPRTFSSIPATMWWGIVTLTTVGYGDMAPVTDLGRLLGGAIAVLGIGMFALPAGLLGAAFVDQLGKARQERRHHGPGAASSHGPTCPHCGHHLGGRS